jgi:hypothetical protein
MQNSHSPNASSLLSSAVERRSLRHPNEFITPQAAQKWLSVKAKPTADKIETLANWLSVPTHWLRYGSANGEQSIPTVRQTKSHQALNADLSHSEFVVQLFLGRNGRLLY